MGYTNYWTRTRKNIPEDFLEEVKTIIADCTSKGITICNGHGENEPIIKEDAVIFNGTQDNDLWHESFYITNSESELGEWQFCKTAEKPYDYAVKKVLEVAEKYGLVEGVSDDGEVEFLNDEEYVKKYGR